MAQLSLKKSLEYFGIMNDISLQFVENMCFTFHNCGFVIHKNALISYMSFTNII